MPIITLSLLILALGTKFTLSSLVKITHRSVCRVHHELLVAFLTPGFNSQGMVSAKNLLPLVTPEKGSKVDMES